MERADGRLRELLRIAAASRTAGDVEAMRAACTRAYDAARAADDVDGMTEAAVGLAAAQSFGTVPGRVPALLHEAYARTSGTQRARIAVAIARAWVYGGDAARAVRFAAEAEAVAMSAGDAALLAEALDAQLLVHWGPDDLSERLAITSRLEDAVQHLPDVEARLSAHLWRLTTAVECLDLTATQRQLRALDFLAGESGSDRVRFFAAARRGMYALLTGDLGAAARARDGAVAAGTAAGERDTEAIDRTLSAGIARQTGDRSALEREASLFEGFGAAEGVAVVAAEGAGLWLAAGRPERAAALLHQLAGSGFGAFPRDVDWLFTVAALTEVAAATGETALTAEGADLLAPYAGRAVVNAGAVTFMGVVDEYRYRALLALGRPSEAEAARSAAERACRRMAAAWWLRRISAGARAVRPVEVVHLHPSGDGVWEVGFQGTTTALADSKGLHYLRVLLGRPGTDVRALDLSDAVAGHPGVQLGQGDLGPPLDTHALAAYRRRLRDLDEELTEARTWADLARADRLAEERTALIGELGRATGLGGRPRRAGDVQERARVAVRKAVAAAVGRIEAADPALGSLLRGTVSTGGCCRYDPDPGRPVRWVLQASPERTAGG